MKWVLLILVLDNGRVWEKMYPTEADCLADQTEVTEQLTNKGVSFISKCRKIEDVRLEYGD